MIESLTIIVPAYNEAATIRAVLDRLQTVPLPVEREIIVVNDGSRDGTAAALDAAAAGRDAISVIHSPDNRGKGHAVRLGIARARGTIMAIQDADLELDPAQLAELVQPIVDRQADVVYGSRFLAGRPPAPWLTIVANRTLTAVTNLLYGAAITDMETCYKVMRVEIARGLELSANRFDIEPEITAKLLRRGHRIHERPIRFMPRSRAAGKKIGWRDAVAAIGTLLRHRRWQPAQRDGDARGR